MFGVGRWKYEISKYTYQPSHQYCWVDLEVRLHPPPSTLHPPPGRSACGLCSSTQHFVYRPRTLAPQNLLWWLQKMPVRGSDAQQAETRGNGDSSPETFSSGHHNSRLAMPRDWRSTINRRKSETPGGSANSSCRKEQQRQAQLEMDGEWYADARGSPGLKAEKVSIDLHICHDHARGVDHLLFTMTYPGATHVESAAHLFMRASSILSFGLGG